MNSGANVSTPKSSGCDAARELQPVERVAVEERVERAGLARQVDDIDPGHEVHREEQAVDDGEAAYGIRIP